MTDAVTAMLRLAHGSEPLEPATVIAAQRGESWARSLFVRRYGRVVWGLVWRMLGRQRTLAEDVAQDALVAVLVALPRLRYEGAPQLTKWVTTIAARTAIDAMRRTRVPPAAVGDADASEPSDPHDDPERGAERRAIGRAIAEAVEQLGPEIRAAFVLRAYHEFDYAEIAEALDIDVGTVKSRLFRARTALAKRLEEVRRG